MTNQANKLTHDFPTQVSRMFFGCLSVNVFCCFVELPLINFLAAISCMAVLLFHLLVSTSSQRVLLIVLSIFITLTITTAYLRQYHGAPPAFPIFMDLFYCSTLMVIFLKFRFQNSAKPQSDWKQIATIFGIGIPFIYFVFENVNFDYQILIMFRMIIFAITIFYGLFRPYMHRYVSYGVILNIVTTFFSGMKMFINPKMIPFEIQTVIYLIGMYLIITGVLRTANRTDFNFKS
ncbi:hypothetical protein SAMN06298216_4544 [Spirosomataceae bacterium TFI 002]|nr:hypothetical protein SAMN06298216_0006 [Spirosomataceae bacterium TFI 002]SOE24182.1 hypothetical protein SAMN06298216_4544 [Spirosomataceae bacterium TFI 002]